MGTRLEELGFDLHRPGWSARAGAEIPDVVEDVHRQYVGAGAEVLIANTFRTTPRHAPSDWRELLGASVACAQRAATDSSIRVAGSIAPVEDCYRPDLSPSDAADVHAVTAAALAASGCDLILCETFAHAGEAIEACRAGVRTGVETWVALTAGPGADLMRTDEMGEAARALAGEGASAVLVNCVPATQTLGFVRSIAGCGVRIGAYANAGSTDDGIGWNAGEPGAARFAEIAKAWVLEGAEIVGGCCGTGPEHIAAIRDAFSVHGELGAPESS